MRTAVIPAAGMGTRFLPATRATPKELLPIYDTPALQFVVNEAAQAGIERIIVVTSRSKPSIEAYVAAVSTPSVEVTVVYQDLPRGLGHAIWCARDAVSGEPFAVLLPDEIMGDASLLTSLVELYEKTGKNSIALKKVAMSEVVHYGNVSVTALNSDNVASISQVIEKPSPSEVVSDLVIIGRYVFAPNVFDHLAVLTAGASGELQLTDTLQVLAQADLLLGIVSDVARYDTGTPMGLLRAAIDISLTRKDVGPQLQSWLEAKFRQ